MNIKYIHVGKTGGTTLNFNFKLKGKHSKIKINENDKIILWLRNPITRLVSAFNFAKYIVNYDCNKVENVQDLDIENNIGCERIQQKILRKKKYFFSKRFDNLINSFENVNDFLESLSSKNLEKKFKAEELIKYSYGLPNYGYVGFFKGFSFYLDEEFIKTNKDKIIFIGTCENMSYDLEKLSNLLNIGITKGCLRKNNTVSNKFLSKIAVKNIYNIYKNTEFKILEILLKYNLIKKNILDSYINYYNQ